jgi:hypothetical protein
MHVKSITWNQLYTLLGTHRNKPHPKPRSELPPASSMVILGRAADGPPNQVGRSVTHGQKPSKTCVLLPSLADGPPRQPGQPVLTQIHTETLLVLRGLAVGLSGTSGRTVRHFIANGPQLLFTPYVILYNSYKNVYSSEKCEINFVGFIMMSRSCKKYVCTQIKYLSILINYVSVYLVNHTVNSLLVQKL